MLPLFLILTSLFSSASTTCPTLSLSLHLTFQEEMSLTSLHISIQGILPSHSSYHIQFLSPILPSSLLPLTCDSLSSTQSTCLFEDSSLFISNFQHLNISSLLVKLSYFPRSILNLTLVYNLSVHSSIIPVLQIYPNLTTAIHPIPHIDQAFLTRNNTTSTRFLTSSTSDGSMSNFKKYPMIFTIITVASFLVSLGWSVVSKGMNSCILVSISIGGVVEVVSWCIVLGYQALDLSEDQNTSNIAVLSILAAVILVMLSMNVFFTLALQIWIIRRDEEHAKWLNTHKATGVFIYIVVLLISYKFIRMIYSRLFNLENLSATFTLKNKLYKIIIALSVLSFVFLTLPIIGVYAYLLTSLETYSTLWIIILDSLITTCLVSFLSILDVFYMILEVNLSLHATEDITTKIAKNQRKNTEVMETKRSITQLNKTYITDISNNIAVLDNLEDEEINLSPIVQEQNENTLKPVQTTPKCIKQLVRRNTIYSEDVLYSLLKSKIHNEKELDLSQALIDEYDKECIRVYHLTYGLHVIVRKSFDGAVIIEDSRSNGHSKLVNPRSYQLIEVDSQDVHLGKIQIRATGEILKVKRQFSGCEVIDLKKGDRWIIGRTVNETEDFDMMKAEVDPDDSEDIIVTHFKTNFRVKIKKTFNGAARVDLITGKTLKEDDTISNYDASTVQVDLKDLSYGYVWQDGFRVKLKRNFLGAPIVDIYYPKLLSELRNPTTKHSSKLHPTTTGSYIPTENTKTTKEIKFPSISYIDHPKELKNNQTDHKHITQLDPKLKRLNSPQSSQVLILKNQGIRLPVAKESNYKKTEVPSVVPFPRFNSPTKTIPDFSLGPSKDFGS